MTSTSYPDFNSQTEGIEVAKAFAEQIKGKTVLITGVNRKGIGFTTAEGFASQSPAHLILAGRNVSKIQECIEALREQFPQGQYSPLEIDLSSQKSVRKAAEKFLSWAEVPTLDILVNNAGTMFHAERTLTEDGIEVHFATNHIGHFLFTSLIMPKLIKAAQSSPRGSIRIINVTSGSPTVASMRWSDVNFDKLNKDLPQEEQPPYQFLEMWGCKDSENKAYIPVDGYNRSKVANVLFGIAANNRLYEKYGILSLAVHPGVIKTELSRIIPPETVAAIQVMVDKGMFSYKTLAAGASTSLVAALDPKLGVSEKRDTSENYGAFLVDCQISDKAHPLAVSSKEAERLWGLSEDLVHEKFAW